MKKNCNVCNLEVNYCDLLALGPPGHKELMSLHVHNEQKSLPSNGF